MRNTIKSLFNSRLGNLIINILFLLLFPKRLILILVLALLSLAFYTGIKDVFNESQKFDEITNSILNSVLSVTYGYVDKRNEGLLIHVSGEASTNEILEDKLFGVKEGALMLRRTVEMYQWHEKNVRDLNSEITSNVKTTYYKDWSKNLIDSSKFKFSEKHKNPSKLPYKTKSFVAKDISVGSFKLGKEYIKEYTSEIQKYYTPYNLTRDNYNKIDNRLKKYIKLNRNKYFYGTPLNPKIGSIRISYDIVKMGNISVIGTQKGDTIHSYTINNEQIKLLNNRILSPEEMISHYKMKHSVDYSLLVVVYVSIIIIVAAIYLPSLVMNKFVKLIGQFIKTKKH
ncbi:MAG: hypothetical protein COV35_04800 [Alphaproteobacteria bacterium CG11_big_fil_rev_8_21_14_0_20_39_49]|nr:MAG: hypothetical protein COV35_04800 [Alphaproteobacteria bacterium CG11_big_fil_rev_8_21_14_0_20_39_49]